MSTLRQLRVDSLISQRELANLAGVSESTVVRMEDPRHRTRQDMAEKVVQALGKRIGKDLKLDDIEGLNLYNIMRDRRQRMRGDVD